MIFAQMVDDPSGYADELLANADKRRAAIEELKQTQAMARAQIAL